MGIGTCLKCGRVVTILKSGRSEAHETKGKTCEGSRKPPRGQL